VIRKSVVRRDAESFAPPVDKCQRVRCESITPLGTPVEPDVNAGLIAGLLQKVIRKGERRQRQRSRRRLIDEVDCIGRALVTKRTAQLLIKLTPRDQRAKRALTTNLLEARTGPLASTGT
jgi:hypothetical protein